MRILDKYSSIKSNVEKKIFVSVVITILWDGDMIIWVGFWDMKSITNVIYYKINQPNYYINLISQSNDLLRCPHNAITYIYLTHKTKINNYLEYNNYNLLVKYNEKFTVYVYSSLMHIHFVFVSNFNNSYWHFSTLLTI